MTITFRTARATALSALLSCTLVPQWFTAATVIAAAPGSDIPLALSYRNDPADGLTSDGLMSLSGQPYQYVDGLPDNVSAILIGGGNFIYSAQYDPKRPIRRALCLNFGSQASPFGAQVVCPHANQNMAAPLDNLTNSTPLSAMHPGDAVAKR